MELVASRAARPAPPGAGSALEVCYGARHRSNTAAAVVDAFAADVTVTAAGDGARGLVRPTSSRPRRLRRGARALFARGSPYVTVELDRSTDVELGSAAGVAFVVPLGAGADDDAGGRGRRARAPARAAAASRATAAPRRRASSSSAAAADGGGPRPRPRAGRADAGRGGRCCSAFAGAAMGAGLTEPRARPATRRSASRRERAALDGGRARQRPTPRRASAGAAPRRSYSPLAPTPARTSYSPLAPTPTPSVVPLAYKFFAMFIDDAFVDARGSTTRAHAAEEPLKYRLTQRDDFVFPMTLYQCNTLHVDKTRSNEFKLLRGVAAGRDGRRGRGRRAVALGRWDTTRRGRAAPGK
ncbi:hypothetical protein SO694_00001049 [Aureococcus anophagefferens]|uniref:Uncharacterized protein n=1 Tax=Aureococcus anophagefferens TaxID=44056 RepID=A0ABR1GBM4_AURAN